MSQEKSGLGNTSYCSSEVLQLRLFSATAEEKVRTPKSHHLNCFAGEHVAPYLSQTGAEDPLPANHPVQTFQGTPGLPQGCITYQERYSHVEKEQDRWISASKSCCDFVLRVCSLVRSLPRGPAINTTIPLAALTEFPPCRHWISDANNASPHSR